METALALARESGERKERIWVKMSRGRWFHIEVPIRYVEPEMMHDISGSCTVGLRKLMYR